jgi:hypothetical protein
MVRREAFSIRLLPAGDRGPGGERAGEIRVGVFVERFAVYPFDGTEEAMADRWLDELRRLVDGAPAVGLPTATNATWVLYRSGGEVMVRQMLMSGGVGPTLAPGGRVTAIPARRAVDEDGRPVSEWSTTVEAVAAFVDAGPSAAARRQPS